MPTTTPSRSRRTVLLAAAACLLPIGSALFIAAVTPTPGAGPRFPTSQPGVAPGSTFFVGGHVRRPGAYTTGETPVTVRQAILQAGGAEEGTGSGSFVTVYRRHPGETEVIKINLRPLLDDGMNDEAIWPRDQILVHDKR